MLLIKMGVGKMGIGRMFVGRMGIRKVGFGRTLISMTNMLRYFRSIPQGTI